jgi:non-heme chloroperoxidase
VTRYLGKHGSDRVAKAMIFGAIPPFLLKTDDNPEGVDGSVFEGAKEAALKDRYAWFKQFLDDFYNVDKFAPERISEQAWQGSFNVACMMSPYASYVQIDAWLEDFHEDLAKLDVPTLVMHGTEDRILPFESTAKRLPDLIDDVKLVPVDEGPHNIGWTHPEIVNPVLLAFLEGGLEAVDAAREKVATA